MKILIKSFIILLLVLSNSYAQTSTIVSSAPIHQSASIQSTVIATLNEGTQVTVLKRSGGWKLIQTHDDKPEYGWLRSYKVRPGTLTIVKTQESSDGFFSGLANLSRKASGLFSSEKKDYSFQSTATIGVRGLSEEQIKNASPDLKQLKKMDSFRVSKNSAVKFAKQGALKSIKIKHLAKSKVEK